MSFQSIITQQLAILTERLNAIAVNAKKIVELPWQSVLRPSSEIHISDSGKSYKIKIQQIFDWFYSQRQNQLLSVSISVEVNDIKVESGAQWIIDNINYSTLNNTTIHIPYAENGYTRNDILIANKNNQITRILGTETVGISPTPPTPTGTVLVTIVNVTDATIGYVPPIIGGEYEKVINKATDFAIVNDQLYPTVKASKTYTDNVGVTKLDKNNAATTNPQAYIKKADGTQTMFDIETVLSGSANKLADSSSVKAYLDNRLSLKELISNKATDFSIINDVLYPTVKSVKTQLDTKISLTEKGAANGIGTLDANGKAPLSQMNDALLGNVKYKGLYNGVVISSSPDVVLNGTTLPTAGPANTGWYFIASAPFTNSGKDYANGDWIISNGVIWDRVDNTDAVSTVFGRVGHITAQNGDYTTGLVIEVSNKNYQTDNQKLFNDATSSIQNQLNSKQPNLGFIPEPAFSKNTAFNKNFGVIAGTVAEGNDSRILNGQTAFGWGNHASAGYVFSNGSNASGNWGINITGNSASATKWNGVDLFAGTYISGTIASALLFNSTNNRVEFGTANNYKSWLGLSNAITGTGTTNFIPKFTASGVLENSRISDNGTVVQIGGAINISGTGYFPSKLITITGAEPTRYSGNIGSTLVGGSNYAMVFGTRNNNTDYDNTLALYNGNVGIGTVTTTAKLTLSGINEGACMDILNTSQNLKTRIGTGNVGGHFFIENNAGVEILRVGQDGNVGIGGSPVSGGSASKWINLNGTTTYSGGIVSSIQGVQKSFFYTDNNFSTIQGTTGVGAKLIVNGDTDALIALSNGNVGIGVTPQTKFQTRVGSNLNIGFESADGSSVISSFNDSGSTNQGLIFNASGYEFRLNGSAKISIAPSGNTVVSGTITASGGFFNSDETLKDVIKRDGNVAYYKWKDGRDNKTHIGYIAQEVKKTNPDQVIKGEDGILSVNYIEILVQEIQSLKNEIQVLKGGRHGVC